MTAPFELVLAGDPVGKGRPRFSKATGHVYTPEKSARFEERLAWAAQSVWQSKPLMDGQIIMFINAYFSIPVSKPKDWKIKAMAGIIRPVKKPDIDNIIKAFLDSMNGIIYDDDTQVVSLHSTKRYGTIGMVEVLVKEDI